MAVMESSTKVVLGGTRGGPGVATLRKDRWWLQPVVTCRYSRPSSSTRRGPRSRTRTTTWAPTSTAIWSAPSTHPASRHTASPAPRPGSPSAAGALSPALLILIFPLGFRLTCYYYRRSYYRAFWWSPPSCAVGRRPRRVLGRDPLPAHHAEPAPLLLLRRSALQLRS